MQTAFGQRAKHTRKLRAMVNAMFIKGLLAMKC